MTAPAQFFVTVFQPASRLHIGVLVPARAKEQTRGANQKHALKHYQPACFVMRQIRYESLNLHLQIQNSQIRKYLLLNVQSLQPQSLLPCNTTIQ